MWEGMENLLFTMKNCTKEEYYILFPEIEQWFLDRENLLTPKCEHQSEIHDLCGKLTYQLKTFPVWMQVHILSFCMKCSESAAYAERLMEVILEADDNELVEYEKYFLGWQIARSIFCNTKLHSQTMEKSRAKLYRNLYQAFYQALQAEKYSYIPVGQRNQDIVFVFTSQFLSEEHGPTKTACDRICYLQKHLGKKVLLINTAMLMTQKGDTPFYRRELGGYVTEYLPMTHFRYQDEIFEFYQCENNMPDLDVMQKLLRMVSEKKPYCIIDIGGEDICADLCGTIVPEITVSTVPSEIAFTTGRFQIVERDLNETDYELLEILGVKRENVEKALFTYVFKEQNHHYTRKEFGLSENGRVLLITGWRLDYEIQEDFLRMLEKLLVDKTSLEVVFMGLFETYKQKIGPYPELQKKSHYFEHQKDALAVTELCDIYVNPKRKGGGTSSAEALYKGLPVVTLPYGDVSEAAGKAFWVRDYDSMGDKIMQYCEDTAYYEKMSELALERAASLTDSKTHFGEALMKIEKKRDFQ